MPTLNEPTTWGAGLKRLQRQQLAPLGLSSAQWSHVPIDIREASFFSARVTSAAFLQEARDLCDATVTGKRGENGMLTVQGAQDFVDKMQAFCRRNGMGGQILNPRDVKQINTSSRLRLIFETTTRSAYGYTKWLAGMDPAMLASFPCLRFVRYPGARIKRDLHRINENEVRRKDDPFWVEMNAKDIGGFEVPWPPFGFNSWMDVEPVGRGESERIGAIRPGELVKRPKIPGLTDKLEASPKLLDDDLRRRLDKELGHKVPQDPETPIRPAPRSKPEVIAPTRAAQKRVDEAESKLRKLPKAGPNNRPTEAGHYVRINDILPTPIPSRKEVKQVIDATSRRLAQEPGDQWQETIEQIAEQERVDLSELIPTQETVKATDIQRLFVPMATGERSLDSPPPPTVAEIDGKRYIWDGHHRIGARLLLGFADILANIIKIVKP